MGVDRTKPLSSRRIQVASEMVILSSRSKSSRDLPSIAFYLFHSGTFVHVLSVFSGLLDQEAVTVHQRQNDWGKGSGTAVSFHGRALY